MSQQQFETWKLTKSLTIVPPILSFTLLRNPISESVYLPDEHRWIVKSPMTQKVRIDSDPIFPAE